MTNKENCLFLIGSGFSVPYLNYKNFNLDTKVLTDFVSDGNLFSEFLESYNNSSTGFTISRENKETLYKIFHVSRKIYKLLLKIKQQNQTELRINFEDVFHVLELLLDYKTENSIYYKLIYTELKSDFKNLKISDIILFKHIFLDFVSQFRYNNENDNLKKYIINTFDNYEISWNTLNYDLLLLDILGSEDFMNRFSLNVSEPVDRNYILSKEFPVFNPLHGFALFSDNLTNISLETNHDTASKKRIENSQYHEFIERSDIINLFISGKNKSFLVQNSPFNHYLIRFMMDIQKSNKVVIIGYSFQDIHINSILNLCFPKSLFWKVSSNTFGIQKVLPNLNEVIIVDLDTKKNINSFINSFAWNLGITDEIDFTTEDFNKEDSGVYYRNWKQENFKITFYLNGIEEFIEANTQKYNK
jgi:hypothetical protein